MQIRKKTREKILALFVIMALIATLIPTWAMVSAEAIREIEHYVTL